MSEKKQSGQKPVTQKPVTLADYIPDEPVITPAAKKAARDSLSKADRARLEALERAVRETEADAVHASQKTRGRKTRGKKAKSRANQRRDSDPRKMNKLVFWAIVIMLIVGFALSD